MVPGAVVPCPGQDAEPRQDWRRTRQSWLHRGCQGETAFPECKVLKHQIGIKQTIISIIIRIHEVNQHLNSLMSSDISFPMSINLAVSSGGTGGSNKDLKDFESQITRLKDQNR